MEIDRSQVPSMSKPQETQQSVSRSLQNEIVRIAQISRNNLGEGPWESIDLKFHRFQSHKKLNRVFQARFRTKFRESMNSREINSSKYEITF